MPDTLVLTTYICSGIARLARFNATVALVPKDATGKSKYFEGLPIPSSLFICAAMAVSLKNGYYVTAGGKGPGLPFGLIEPLQSIGIDLHWASLVFAAWGMMMISKTLRCAPFSLFSLLSDGPLIRRALQDSEILNECA